MINNRLKRGTYSYYSIFLHFWLNLKSGFQHKISYTKKKAEQTGCINRFVLLNAIAYRRRPTALPSIDVLYPGQQLHARKDNMSDYSILKVKAISEVLTNLRTLLPTNVAQSKPDAFAIQY